MSSSARQLAISFPTSSGGHSADVRLELIASGQTFPLAQLGPEMIILDSPADLPPCRAEVFMSVDGHETRWPVLLPDGISAASRIARIATAD